jgi:hypothetical protein
VAIIIIVVINNNGNCFEVKIIEALFYMIIRRYCKHILTSGRAAPVYRAPQAEIPPGALVPVPGLAVSPKLANSR